MLDPHLVIVGALVQVGGFMRYIQRTLRGEIVPHRLTWLLWAVAAVIAFAAELSEGVGLRSLMTLSLAIGPFLIFVATFVPGANGLWGVTRFDRVCGALSVGGLVLWLVTGRGNVAIAMSLASDASAAAPTFRKAIVAPETESYSTYVCAAINAMITLLTISRWTFAEAAWPVYIFLIGTVLTILIRRRRPVAG